MMVLLAMSGQRSVRLMHRQKTKLGTESSARELALKILLLSFIFFYLFQLRENKIKTAEKKKKRGEVSK